MAQIAQAAIIDFESLEQNNASVNYVGFSYTEDGFTLNNLSSPTPFGVFGTQESRYPGSTALFNDNVNGLTQLTLAMTNGDSFDLNSIDLTSLNGNYSVNVTFTGTKADSSLVIQSFTTDAVLGTLETFNFAANFTENSGFKAPYLRQAQGNASRTAF